MRRAAGIAAFALVVLISMLVPSVARADDVDEFVHARDAYNNTDYDVAITQLQILLDRRPPISPTLID